MTDTVFVGLIQNAALLLAAAFCYDVMTSSYRFKPGGSLQVAIGAMLGILGCILILSPWTYVPGIVFDTRSVLLSISGLFFGIIPTTIAMAITAAFRLSLGGAAAWTGVAVILATGSMGIAWRHARRSHLEDISWSNLYLFGLVVHLVMLALMFILPKETALRVLSQTAFPVMAIYPLATVLLGMLMLNRLKRERNTAELISSQEQMRLFFERQIAGMAITSPAKGWLRVNDQFCRMLGYSREQLDKVTWEQLTHPDDLQADLDQFQALLEGSIDEYSMEKRYIRKDGSVLWTVLSVGCVRKVDGSVDYILALLVNISERKKAEESLRLFEVLVENSSDAIGMSTPEGRHFYQNKAFSTLFGDIGEDVPATVYVDHAVGREVFRKAMAGGRWEGEVKMYARDKRILDIFLRAYANKDSSGRIIGLVGVHTDITEQRQAQEEKERLQEQLLQAQKMESIGRLAGGVAHDFNNMLQTIFGYCDLALQDLDSKEPLHEQLLEIRNAAQRSAALTRQLLAFARKQTVNPQVLDLNDTVASMLKMLQRLIGEDIKLAWLPGHDLWPVIIDPSQVDQLLANLMVNARDAIQGTGLVTIKTENVELDEDFFVTPPTLAAPGEYVLLSISDDGSGMDKETLGHIFEPFFTTKEQGKGTGLGLATVYGIIKQNNGFIDVTSKPGQGTTCMIYLPRSGQKMDDQPSQTSPAKASLGTETVLIVEDEETILKLGITILRQLGYTVLSASTPKKALELAKSYDAKIHLLLTDVVMPDMNGLQLAAELASIHPGIKCLYMSGYTADIIAQHGLLEKDLHLVRKPFTINEMADKVREALND